MLTWRQCSHSGGSILQELEAAQLEEARLEAVPAPAHTAAVQAAVPALPSTPAATPQQARSPEDEELEALQAELAA